MWAQNYSGRPGSCANSAKLVLNLEKLFEHVNGQTQLEPESCVKHRVWKAMRDGECECACTSQCVRGKTDEKHLKKENEKIRHPLMDRKKSWIWLQENAPVTAPPTHRVVSHCSAVLYAGLGGDVGPGQQRAQQGLGLSVQPLGDGAGAQAGYGWTDVLNIVSGTGS